ncbi:hypothetical protein QTO34_016204 [Cnephaeus nilssonii]|uniref:RING-type E3 ubiquitin transferase n=1 Tax=Cnephaeus nilssonii TaxID=3371016 RepID=A0AA40LTU8_CNENI|nr:hypothetical protein QTO34_016204 [Eptesicus nilssonii]
MDDLTLLDLLECPVCLEKLDVTAKVLPCQHTFCKPCLQRISKAHKGLRCPECRTLVFGSIEALPANLLLVRLLDGVRSGPSPGRGGSFRRPGVLALQDGRKSRTHPRGLQASPFRLVPNIRIHMDGVPRAKALCNYRGQNPGDLRFNKGDVILLRRQLDENWYQGEINGVSGFFPASSVEVIKQLPQPPPLCRALYNFDLRNKDKSDNQDCLTFLKDDIITVISRVDENWAEGKLGDKIGIFPILFVEPNLTARHLLEKNKGRQPSRTKSLSLVSSSSRGKGPNTPSLRRGPGSRRKGPGQLSITTALNTLNRMVHSPSGRHMVEISTPVLISSSNPSVISQHMEKADVLPSSLGQRTSLQGEKGTHFSEGVLASQFEIYWPILQQEAWPLSCQLKGKKPGRLWHSRAEVPILHTHSTHIVTRVENPNGIQNKARMSNLWLRCILVVGLVTFFFLSRKRMPLHAHHRPSSHTGWQSILLLNFSLSPSSPSSPGMVGGNQPENASPPDSVISPAVQPQPFVNASGILFWASFQVQGVRNRTQGFAESRILSLCFSVHENIPVQSVTMFRWPPTSILKPQIQTVTQIKGEKPSQGTHLVAGLISVYFKTSKPKQRCLGMKSQSRGHLTGTVVIMNTEEEPCVKAPVPKPCARDPGLIRILDENHVIGICKLSGTPSLQNQSPKRAHIHILASWNLESKGTRKGSRLDNKQDSSSIKQVFIERGRTFHGHPHLIKPPMSSSPTHTWVQHSAAPKN